MSFEDNTQTFNWQQPGEEEVMVVGSYVAEEVSRMYGGPRGTSRLDVEHVKFVPGYKHYLDLEQALEHYIAETLRIPFTGFDTTLCDKIGKMEKSHSDSKQGLWHRLWYGMGAAKETADAWLGVIPDSYGMAVVKTGIAVVFKLAEDSKEKRDKVFKAFSILQATLRNLHPDRGRFRNDGNVQEAVEATYKAVVKALEDMVLVLSDMKTSKWAAAGSKLKSMTHREKKPEDPRPTLDGVLENLTQQTKSYEEAITLARDRVIERTEGFSRFNAVSTYHEKTINSDTATVRHSKHAAVVGFVQLCSILAQPPWGYESPHKQFNPERSIQHPSIDLHAAVAEQADISLEAQGQAQSLLQDESFLDWMARSHPCLVMVDADMEEATLDALSAISVLSGTLATSLMRAYTQDAAVVVHFFCGLHAAPGDPFHGPVGLVRSLLLQLLTKLDGRDPDMKGWNLDFIDDRDFLKSLEEHSLPHLCEALHHLLYEFPPGTYVYCIVDSVSCFDVGPLLRNLGDVMELFRRVVDDRKLAPIFKVLLTNPGESSWEIRNMPLFREDPSRLITLCRHDVLPDEISEEVVDDHLLAAPPMRGRSPSPFRFSRAPSPRFSRAPSPAWSTRKEPVPVVREV
ncbi:hypothetical protein N658DRAFT_527585 [Parathielavia hyrcaniae]|uniref:Uncharacterized protein n=1 Tax=Parathielavia hyrcaniae TaxID=113614 RepID=A0AAN6PRQ5_9PEZI|nr:hypothetical protein N658DRAFT_527585 [Parathielavia hyrcaniae]